MGEMLTCALEALTAAAVTTPVAIAGHSMGGLCALAFAVEHPQVVGRLIIIGGMSGFPAAVKSGFPGSRWKWYEREYWTVILQGLRIMNGKGSLADHNRYMNLLGHELYADKGFYRPIPISPEDEEIGIPVRAVWPKNLWRHVDYASRLAEVKADTLICVGASDLETPPTCSEELHLGINGSQLVTFLESGHNPFAEEPERFAEVIGGFFGR
jgi:proline iminopeptidase